MNGRAKWLLYSPRRLWSVVGGVTAVVVLLVVGYFLAPSGTPATTTPPATTASPSTAPTGGPGSTPPTSTTSITPTETGEPEGPPATPTPAGLEQAAMSAATPAIVALTRTWLQGSGNIPQGTWLAQLRPLAGPDVLANAEAMTRQARDRIPKTDVIRLEYTAATSDGAIARVVLRDGTKLMATAIPADRGRWVVTELEPDTGEPVL